MVLFNFTKMYWYCLYLERRDAEAQGSCPFSSQTNTCGYTVQPKWSIEQKFQLYSSINIRSSDNGISLHNLTQFRYVKENFNIAHKEYIK